MKKYILSILLTSASLHVVPLQESLHRQLIGEWRNVYVKLKINTFKTNKSVTMEADSANWEAKLGIKPIRTFFKDDGTYYSEYWNLKNSIVRRPTGTWSLKGDTITMVEIKPETSITRLHISIDKGKAAFSGMIDFDGDGRRDDEYFGIQRRVNH